MSTYIQNFIKFQPLLRELVSRDIKIKYRRSVLGVLWTLLNPLCMMIVLSLVFCKLFFKFRVENFPLYLLSGQIILQLFFADATTSAMSAVINNAALIKKVYMPKYLFVISRVFSSFINLLASFYSVTGSDDRNKSRIALEGRFFAVIPLGFIVVFSLGVGLLLSALVVKIQRYYAFIF